MNGKIDIRHKVKEILDMAQFKVSPVDLMQIIKMNKWDNIKVGTFDPVELPKSNYSEVYGIIYKKEGKVQIGINKNDPQTRKRFTLAHELGHYVLHMEYGTKHYEEVFQRSNESTIFEIEANYFAAELLMPEIHFKNIYNQARNELNVKLDNPETVEDVLKERYLIKFMAEKFNVSEKSASIRIANLT